MVSALMFFATYYQLNFLCVEFQRMFCEVQRQILTGFCSSCRAFLMSLSSQNSSVSSAYCTTLQDSVKFLFKSFMYSLKCTNLPFSAKFFFKSFMYRLKNQGSESCTSKYPLIEWNSIRFDFNWDPIGFSITYYSFLLSIVYKAMNHLNCWFRESQIVQFVLLMFEVVGIENFG